MSIEFNLEMAGTADDPLDVARGVRRILAGNVQRGAVQEIQSAILVCDLRRFTELSQRLDAGVARCNIGRRKD